MKRLSKISTQGADSAPATVFTFGSTKSAEENSNKMEVDSIRSSEFSKKNSPADLSMYPTQQQKKAMQSSNATLSSTPNKAMNISKPIATPKIDKEARLLNLQLEQCLNMTLRKEGVTSSVIFMGTGDVENEYVNASNMIELICSRLSGQNSDILNAISYLYGCYKKILMKEATAIDKLREDLLQ